MPAPRVLVIEPNHWPRVHIRSALRAVGYDAIGALNIDGALVHPPHAAGRGPVRAVVLDSAVVKGHEDALQRLSHQFAHPAIVLLAPVVIELPTGTWTRVLRRPVSVGDVVQAVSEAIPLPPDQLRPIDDTTRRE